MTFVRSWTEETAVVDPARYKGADARASRPSV
ncbi:unnamed protein product [Ectocarpus sp. CCAP 1310/34]|nr:unnamed protein product [Ectocarpus sp. CCAP 1310/34]